MSYTSDFLLERVVHQVLKGDLDPALVREATTGGFEATAFIADILWPAMECVQQLHQDGSTTSRILNTALRSLRSLLESAALRLDRHPQNGRSAFIFTAPDESADLGAHMFATLAEAHGWRVFFAGAGLTLEELTFSIGQLGPDILVIHGSLAASAGRAAEMIRQLRRIRIWPSAQIVLAGTIAASSDQIEADLSGKHPLEALELMALWPEFRRSPSFPTTPGNSLQMLQGSAANPMISADMIREMMRRHFGKRGDHPN
jgi:methanogenic corrinoid protein MtbC1